MRVFLIVIFILGGAVTASAQLLLRGRITDAATRQPIPYVNIGLVGRGIGTVSDADGYYELWVREASPDDLLRISCLGYEPLTQSWEDLPEGPDISFTMRKGAIALDEVVVSVLPTYTLEEIVGYPLASTRDFAYWKDSLALGAELASRIRVSPGTRRLNTLFFNTTSNPADSVLVRINCYAFPGSGGKPAEPLNKSGQSILYTLPGGASEAVVDLMPFDLWVEDDFYLSLELLAVYGSDEISLTMPAAAESRGATYRRYASQGEWEKIGAYGVGYALQTTYYTNDPRKARNRVVERSLKRSQAPVGGFVFFGRRALEGIRVENLNTREETTSDTRGRYRLLASPGDVLRFTRPGGDFLILKIRETGTLTVNLKGM
ncbi:carboxypeptidase-like regulatory domain-containing protein [Robiginitalea sediminis]|uniref:carboxypeptidase-like regulatory domain-containing protein n=1 Tax=Robiginitalea sediminis TaxID=1982593 RepID=UPI000B4BF64F|nr:carboxypeptidase-like regulatory domain-containing protein [Robiginitalea sediminis]